MRQKNSPEAAGKPRQHLLEKGAATLALGAIMLLASLFLDDSPMLRAASQGLLVAGPLALLIGAALIGLHLVLRRRPPEDVAVKKEPVWTSWAPPELVLGKDHPLAKASRAGAADPDIEDVPASRVRQRPAQWSRQVFEDIEGRRFEAVCEQLFGQAGFETRSQPHGADGGVDIWLHSRHAQGPAAIVRCKHWHGQPVGVRELREFHGVMASHQLKRGTYATSSTFAADAARFAKENGINALDADRLLALIAKRTPQQQGDLLATAHEGGY